MDGAAREDRTLGRIAAVLMALAVMAERAGGLSFPVRWLVLAILRAAESVARTFVVEATGIDASFLDDPSECAGTPLDAAWLALRFRALAAMLCALLRPAWHFDRCNAASARAARGAPPRPCRLVAAPGGRAQGPYDTS